MIVSSARAGPVISVPRHAVLQLGQLISPEDVRPPPAEFASAQAKKGRASGLKKGRSGVTLKDLMDGDVLAAGQNKITVSYKGTTYTASLTKDGVIEYQGQQFGSATSFSIHCKRQQTPNKQGDDGWKSVMYEGQPLETFRKTFVSHAGSAETLPEEGETDGKAARPQDEQTAKDQDSTDQWVQCETCKTWRIVPEAAWAAVEADTRDEWLCSYATWDVSLHAPFTPSCAQAAES